MKIFKKVGSRRHRGGSEQVVEIGRRIFDAGWYAKQNPHRIEGDPFKHYLKFGDREGLDPSPFFLTTWYREQNPDVAGAAVNALIHYIESGASEGRQPHPLFDTQFYEARYVDVRVSRVNPLQHYIENGAAELRWPNARFDPEFYIKQNPEARGNPLLHYIEQGSRYDLPTISDDFRKAGHRDAIGAIVARTLPNDINPSVRIPFSGRHDIAFDKVAVIAHVFYPDVLDGMLGYISNIPQPMGLFVSTDTAEKRELILETIAKFDLFDEVDVRILPNRGRDIAPKLIGFRDVYERYPAFLHLHSKKSPHAGDVYAGWRDHLLEGLIGTREIALSNLSLLSETHVGAVYREHANFIKPVINWGYDFDLAKDLLKRVGVRLDAAHILEFPSGSMFWARSEAIRPLLDLGLDWDDFPPEEGQIDGTLAHAIERCMLYFVEAAGFQWRRTTLAATGKPVAARRFRSLLSSNDDLVPLAQTSIPETLRLMAVKTESKARRLNLLVPTLRPEHIFGGISTALKVFLELGAAGDVDLRILVTETSVEGELPISLRAFDVQKLGMETGGHQVVVDCSDRLYAELELSEQDVFVATAWWTAANAFRLLEKQKEFFESARKVIYLIQDYESNFYGWSGRFALAEATYQYGYDTVAVFNSEELANFFSQRYSFSSSYMLPYSPNEKIAAALAPVPREPIILFYSRPSATRNCFEIGLDGIALWARRNPTIAADWKLYCIGERFPEQLLPRLPEALITGKMPLEEYAGLLSRASVGVSLMLSPHPSYPPLEMAFAGVRTITNGYECKDLTQRSSLISSLDVVTAEHLADELERVVGKALSDLNKVTAIRTPIADLSSSAPRYAARDVLEAAFS